MKLFDKLFRKKEPEKVVETPTETKENLAADDTKTSTEETNNFTGVESHGTHGMRSKNFVKRFYINGSLIGEPIHTNPLYYDACEETRQRALVEEAKAAMDEGNQERFDEITRKALKQKELLAIPEFQQLVKDVYARTSTPKEFFDEMEKTDYMSIKPATSKIKEMRENLAAKSAETPTVESHGLTGVESHGTHGMRSKNFVKRFYINGYLIGEPIHTNPFSYNECEETRQRALVEEAKAAMDEGNQKRFDEITRKALKQKKLLATPKFQQLVEDVYARTSTPKEFFDEMEKTDYMSIKPKAVKMTKDSAVNG